MPALRWALPAGRAVTVALLIVLTLLVAEPAHRVAVVVALVVSVAGVVYGLRHGPERWLPRLIGLCLLAAGGIALTAIDAHAPGWLACGAAILAGFARLPVRVATPYVLIVAVATGLAPLARGDRAQVPLMVAAVAVALLFGVIIGSVQARAEHQAEDAAQRDRLRLAREIHDILAHTLSAQSVQLEGARLLAERNAPPADLLPHIRAAQRLTRDGLDETRRAVQAFRDELPPLDETLRRLSTEVQFSLYGVPWPADPPAALAVERVVQEALTNARRHAPGAEVTVTVNYRPDELEVEVRNDGVPQLEPELRNDGPPELLAELRNDGGAEPETKFGGPESKADVRGDGGAEPETKFGGPESKADVRGDGGPESEADVRRDGGPELGAKVRGDDSRGRRGAAAHSEGGYGLAGMRERAALIGARFEAGPDGEGFRVCLTVPRARPPRPPQKRPSNRR